MGLGWGDPHRVFLSKLQRPAIDYVGCSSKVRHMTLACHAIHMHVPFPYLASYCKEKHTYYLVINSSSLTVTSCGVSCAFGGTDHSMNTAMHTTFL